MSLISEIRQDLDASALQLITEYRDRLFAEAVRLSADVSAAEDLVSCTLVKAIRNLESHRKEESVFAWMKSIMLNLHRNDMRSPVRRGTAPVDPSVLEERSVADWSTDEEILRRSDSQALREAMGRLDPEYKKTMVLHYLSEMPVKQIAAVMNVPVGTVLWRLNIARKILARDLAEKLGKKRVAVLLAALLGVGTLFGAWVSPLGDWVSEKVFGSAPEEVEQVESATQVEPASRVQPVAASAAAPAGDNSISQANKTAQKTEGEGGMNIGAKVKKTVAATAVTAMGLAAHGALPAEYQEIEYLESPGNCYVDTGVIGKMNTCCETKMRWVELSNDGGFLASRTGNTRFYMIYSFEGWDMAFDATHVNGTGYTPGADYVVTVTASNNVQRMSLDGEELYSKTGSYSFDTGVTLALFNLHENGTYRSDLMAKSRCYYLKLWQDDELVRDFTPCVRKADDKPGLYDAVTGDFFPGVGNFTLGPNVYDPASVLHVSGEPNDYGEVEPAYGRVVELVAGTNFTCRAPETYGIPGKTLVAVCTGWQLYTNAVGTADEWVAWRAGEGNEFDYTHPAGTGAKLVWQWDARDVAGYANARVTSEATGAFTVSADVTGVGLADGDTLTLKAVWGLSPDLMVYTNDLSTATGIGPVSGTVADVMPGGDVFLRVIGTDRTGAVVVDPGETMTVRVLGANGVTTFLPPAYIPLAYIQSSGSQYIDTEVVGKSGVSAESKMQWVSVPGDGGYLACRGANNVRFYLFYSYQGWYPAYSGGTSVGSIAAGTDYHVYATLSNGTQRLLVDGNVIYDLKNTSSIDTKRNIYLFNMNYDGTPNFYSSSRCYWLKMWRDDAIVRDFTPCRRLADGKNGLYDAVGGEFFDNKGGGTLTGGDPLYDVASILTVEGEPSRAGSPAPGYGEHPAIPVGAAFECRAPAAADSASGRATCTGWILYTNETGKADKWVEWKRGSGTVCPYVHPQGTAAKLVWQWDAAAEAGYENLRVTSDESASFTVSADVTGVGLGEGGRIVFKAAWGRTPDCLDHTNEIATATGIGPVSGSVNDLLVPSQTHYVRVFAVDAEGNPVGGPEPTVAVFVRGANGADRAAPAGYLPLPCLEATGSSYINTGVPGRNGVSVRTKMRWGDFAESYTETSYLAAYGNDGRVYPIFRTNGAQNPWSVSYKDVHLRGYATDPNADCEVYSTVSNGYQVLMVDGKVSSSGSLTGDFDTGNDLTLFTLVYGGSYQYFAKSRCYWLKIWLDDALVRDYMPCQRIADGKNGLYDWVSGTFFTDANGGNFNESVQPLYGQTEMLAIEGWPAAHGEVSPGYGAVSGVPAGTSFDCLAPETADDGATCTGWILYTNETGRADAWVEWTRGEGASLRYVHPEGTGAKLVWQWQATAKVTVTATAGGKIALDGGDPVASYDGLLTEGATYALAAVPDAGFSFVGWRGDLADQDDCASEISVTPTGAMALTAVFAAGPVFHWQGGAANNSAAEPANWREGVVPTSGTTVVLGRGAGDMIWDLADVVPTGWRQLAGCAAKVTIPTTFGAAFPVLRINGDVELLGGTWTQASSNDGEMTYRLNVQATGDFTVGAEAGLDVSGRGYAKNTVVKPAASDFSLTNGSVVCPTDFGVASERCAGGGALRMVVGGVLTVDGFVAADGEGTVDAYGWSGSGGSVWLTAKTLAGTGTIRANGGFRGVGQETRGGAGGRVSVMLTEAGADPATFGGKITAYAYLNTATGRPNVSECGTVYLQRGGEQLGCGTVVVANDPLSPATNFIGTLLPSATAVRELRKATLVIRAKAGVRLLADLVVKDIRLEDATSRIDLDGKVLSIRSSYRDYSADKAKIQNAGEWIDGEKPGYANVKWGVPGLAIFFR